MEPPILHQSSRFFEPGKLSGLEKMRFSSYRRVEGAYSGRHVAKRRGGAGEFVDYREYSPGDDLRRIDWKAMGRTGRSYLKLFQDETDLHCTLLLDCSGSMQQGAVGHRFDGSKLQWAQYFATALAHLIVLGRDAVGLAVVRQKLAHYLPPTASMQQRNLIHQQVEQLRASGKTFLSQGLGELLLQSKRRGVLLILSDFLVDDFEQVIAKLRTFRARGWEIIAVHLVHPDEQRLPAGNAFRFTGLEDDGIVNCQLSEIRRAYETRFAEHIQTTRTGLVAVGCDYHFASTAQSYLDVLRSFMVLRSS
ncbi:MAG: DUF58 domain-containing protein [Pirellulaceae bacterium]